MSSSSQQIRCGWTGCGHLFGSEIDMNMHALMNHMILLDHGTFTVNRKAVAKKRIVREVEPPPDNSNNAVRGPTVAQETVTVPPPTKKRSFQETPNATRATSESSITPTPEEIKPCVTPFAFKIKEEEEDSESLNAAMEHIQEHQEHQDLQENQEDIVANSTFYQEAHIPKLLDTLEDIMERLKPMKQLGFIRPNRTIYCIVCLKYTKSIQYCSWKHTPAEERIAEMWHRRYGTEKTTGKAQLMKELEEIKWWLRTGEEETSIGETRQPTEERPL